MLFFKQRPVRIFVAGLDRTSVSFAEFHKNSHGGLDLHSINRNSFPVGECPNESLKNLLSVWRKRKCIKEGAKLSISLSSQELVVRCLRLPGKQLDDVQEMIAFEAQYNIPFTLNEAAWDYQIIGCSVNGMWNVILLAARKAFIIPLLDKVQEAGFSVDKIDGAPTAIYNAFRYNYSKEGGCSLIADFNGSFANLIFSEGERVFIRTICPVDSTYECQIMMARTASQLREESTNRDEVDSFLKEQHGGLSGDNLLNQMHVEILRSLAFYRIHRGGSNPSQVFFCGDLSYLAYLRDWIQQELQIPVEPLNPYLNVNNDVSKVQTLAPLVGLATRTLGNTPLELDLCWREAKSNLVARKLLVVSAAACLIMALGGTYLFLVRATVVTVNMVREYETRATLLQSQAAQARAMQSQLDELRANLRCLINIVAKRTLWPRIISILEESLQSQTIWITRLEPLLSDKPLLPLPPELSKRSTSSPPTPFLQEADYLLIEGLYLDNPQQATVVDEFVQNLSKARFFPIDDHPRVIRVREPPDGRYWAYRYVLVVPLPKL